MCRALTFAAASCVFSPTHRAGVLLVRRFGRAIVGPLIAKATSITNGPQIKLWARNGLWEPTPSLVVFRPPCKGGWGFSSPLFPGPSAWQLTCSCFAHLQWMGIPHSAALPNAVLDWSLGLEVAILPLANRVAVRCISQLGYFSPQSLTVCTSGGEEVHELAASLP